MASDSEPEMAKQDVKSILSQQADEEERIRLKRRYLLGDHLSEAELEKAEIPGTQFLPESLLRKGDIFYEELADRVGIPKREQESIVAHGELEDVNLGSLTDHALLQIASIVTGGSTSSFEKTRPEMKQVVREWLKKDGDDEIVRKVKKAVSDPRNYREDCPSLFTTPICVSPREAALEILEELGGLRLSNQTLLAMRRELTKGSGKVPGRKGSGRDLVEEVRQASEKFLSQGGEELHWQLAKAMAIVDLSRRVTHDDRPTTAIDFVAFSKETKDLQNQIVKALRLLKVKEVKFDVDELKKLHILLEPKLSAKRKSLRSAVKKRLTYYLYECSDMETIPNSLLEALSIVNTSSRNVDHKVFPKEAKEEMRECILNVGAQVKGLLLERIPDHEIDQDYADAKGEEDEDDEEDENDDDDDDDECSFMESTDVSPEVVIRDLPESSSSRIPLDKPESSSSRIPLDKPTLVKEKEVDSNPGTSKKKNQYLALEGISDETSLLAFDLIGCLLEKFADKQGLPLDADARSYLRGQSGGQQVNEQASSKSKKKKRQDKSDKHASSSQDKSDGSIFRSAAQEKIPSLDERTIMRLLELFGDGDKDTVSHPPTAAQNESRKKHKSDVKGTQGAE